jgi:hypothetical protein
VVAVGNADEHRADASRMIPAAEVGRNCNY